MPQDAGDELDRLPPLLKDRDCVLELRIEIFQKLKNWESARVLAESLAKRSPENPNWWIQWAYSLRREKSVEDARAVLLKAASIHPEEGLIPYNLACYACVVGQVEAARKLLEVAFGMCPNLKTIARIDPDLGSIYGKATNSGESTSTVRPHPPGS